MMRIDACAGCGQTVCLHLYDLDDEGYKWLCDSCARGVRL